MSGNKAILFVVFSVLALVVFFVLISMWNMLGSVDSPNQNDQLLLANNEVASRGKMIDPLITPGEAFYSEIIKETDPVLGNKEADLKIIEFGDFQCSFCLQMRDVLAKILPEYKEEVVFVWKDFPNPIHTEAKTAAMAARCAQREGKFWEYHNYLFDNQDNLTREMYNKIALELGLNLSNFNKCLDNKETAELVGAGLEAGQKIGVDATPYLIIGNSVYNYALSEEELKAAVEGRLIR